MRVFVIGNVAIDETFAVDALPRAGESIFGRAPARDIGGKGANQAIVTARGGLDVTFVSATGDDDRGAWIRASLREEDIDCRHVVRFPGASDLSIILTVRAGENAIVTTTDAARALRPEHAEAGLAAARSGDWLLMQGNLDASMTRATLEQARMRGLATALNPSPLKPEFSALLTLADLVVVNRAEALQLGRRANVADAAAELRAHGATSVVVTLGAEGALFLSAAGTVSIAARPQEAIDTTGAGDAFMATAIASAALRGRAAIDSVALEAAVSAAALTISRVGTRRAFPTREEMRMILG